MIPIGELRASRDDTRTPGGLEAVSVASAVALGCWSVLWILTRRERASEAN